MTKRTLTVDGRSSTRTPQNIISYVRVAMLLMITASCIAASTAFLMKPPLITLSKTYAQQQQRQFYISSPLQYSTSQDVNYKRENTTFIPSPSVPVAESSPLAKTIPTTEISPSIDAFTEEAPLATTYSPLDVWQTHLPTAIQGGSIRTWSFDTPSISTVQVHLKSEGRPINANGT
jgi:hypothetical protein